MAAQKTQAIVIRTLPLQEFHKIITFYTPDFGKVKAVAYGIKSPKSRLGGSLELLNYGTLLFRHRENRELQNLTDFNLLNGFDAIRSDFTRITYACYFAELVDSSASEGIANPEIFDLLRTTFQSFVHADDIPLLARGFEIKFLDCTGYGPELARCVHCSADIKGLSVSGKSEATGKFGIAFSIRYGGVLCSTCENRDGAAFTIAPGTCELLKMLRKIRVGTAQSNPRFHPEPSRTETSTWKFY